MESFFDPKNAKIPVNKDFSFDSNSLIPKENDYNSNTDFFLNQKGFGFESYEDFTKNQIRKFETDSLGNIIGIDLDEENKINENDSVSVKKAKSEIQRQIAIQNSAFLEIKEDEIKPADNSKIITKFDALNDPDYDETAGQKLAFEASKVNNYRSHGKCLAGVADILDSIYPQKVPYINSAYLMKGILSSNDGIGAHFKEVSVDRKDLPKLRAGSIVVWNNNADGGGTNVSYEGRIHGHMSISDGKGNEISDFKGEQIVDRDADFTVFIPIS